MRMVLIEDDENYMNQLSDRVQEIAKKNGWDIEIKMFNSYYGFFDYFFENHDKVDFIIVDHHLGNNVFENGINVAVRVLTEKVVPILLITGQEDFGMICAELYEKMQIDYHSLIGYLHKTFILKELFEEKLKKLLFQPSKTFYVKEYGVGKGRACVDVSKINYIVVKSNSREHKIVFSQTELKLEPIVISRKASEEIRDSFDFSTRIKLGEKFYYLNNQNVERVMVSYVAFKDKSVLK